MSDKEIVRKILAALEDAGVKLTEEQAKAAKAELAELKLAPSGSALKDGQIAVDEDHLSGLKQDLKDKNSQRRELKEKIEKLEGERDELKKALDAGDSQNAKLAQTWKDKYEKIEPITKQLMDGVKSRWDSVAEKIPKDMRGQFQFEDTEKGEEGKLADEQYLSNINKLDEYLSIGALKFDDKTTALIGPHVPKASKDGTPPDKTAPDTENMSAEEKLATIYKTNPEVSEPAK